MLTRGEMETLTYGQVLHHVTHRNSDGTPERWRVVGKVKTWARDPDRIEVPVKYGLKGWDRLTGFEAYLLCLTEQEAKSTEEVRLNDPTSAPLIRTVRRDRATSLFRVSYACPSISFVVQWLRASQNRPHLIVCRSHDRLGPLALEEEFIKSLFTDFRLVWRTVVDQEALMTKQGSEALEQLSDATPEGDKGASDESESPPRVPEPNDLP